MISYATFVLFSSRLGRSDVLSRRPWAAVRFTFYFNERIKRIIGYFDRPAPATAAVAAAARGDVNFERKIPLMGDATRDLHSRDWPTSFWGEHHD